MKLFSLLGLVPAQAFRASRSEAAPTDPINGKSILKSRSFIREVAVCFRVGVRSRVCPVATRNYVDVWQCARRSFAAAARPRLARNF